MVTNLEFLTRGPNLGTPGFLANFCRKQERKKKHENEKLIVKKYITFDVQHSSSVPLREPRFVQQKCRIVVSGVRKAVSYLSLKQNQETYKVLNSHCNAVDKIENMRLFRCQTT